MMPSYGAKYIRLIKKAKPTTKKRAIEVANAARMPSGFMMPSGWVKR